MCENTNIFGIRLLPALVFILIFTETVFSMRLKTAILQWLTGVLQNVLKESVTKRRVVLLLHMQQQFGFSFSFAVSLFLRGLFSL